MLVCEFVNGYLLLGVDYKLKESSEILNLSPAVTKTKVLSDLLNKVKIKTLLNAMGSFYNITVEKERILFSIKDTNKTFHHVGSDDGSKPISIPPDNRYIVDSDTTIVFTDNSIHCFDKMSKAFDFCRIKT